MISETALKEFKGIWREEFGEEISDELALEEGGNLLNIINIIYRPIKRDWVEETNNDGTDNGP